MQSTAAAGNPERGRKKRRQFRRWNTYCKSFNQCPTLATLDDPFPFLSCYAYGYRCGDLAPNGSSVKSRTAEEAIRLIGQTLKDMGHWDPRINRKTNKMDKRFTRLWRDWKHYDDPPRRVKPIPMGILLEAQRLADESSSIAVQTTARLIWVLVGMDCNS